MSYYLKWEISQQGLLRYRGVKCGEVRPPGLEVMVLHNNGHDIIKGILFANKEMCLTEIERQK